MAFIIILMWFFFPIQADYYGLAATFHILLHGKFMEIQQVAETGLYQPKTKVIRRYSAL